MTAESSIVRGVGILACIFEVAKLHFTSILHVTNVIIANALVVKALCALLQQKIMDAPPWRPFTSSECSSTEWPKVMW